MCLFMCFHARAVFSFVILQYLPWIHKIQCWFYKFKMVESLGWRSWFETMRGIQEGTVRHRKGCAFLCLHRPGHKGFEHDGAFFIFSGPAASNKSQGIDAKSGRKWCCNALPKTSQGAETRLSRCGNTSRAFGAGKKDSRVNVFQPIAMPGH